MPALPTAVRIALLDDHALFRQGMRYILQSLPYVEAVTEAATLDELLPAFRQQLPDILLLDLQMPHMDGPEVAQVLLQEFPELKIIVLSMFSADKFVTQMMRLGVRSYLPKDVTSEQLICAIEDVLTTGRHLTTHLSQALVRGEQQPARQVLTELPSKFRLTQREKEVLQLIGQGYTGPDIAVQLHISPRTVEWHRQSLLDKTGASNVAGLVAFASRHDLFKL